MASTVSVRVLVENTARRYRLLAEHGVVRRSTAECTSRPPSPLRFAKQRACDVPCVSV